MSEGGLAEARRAVEEQVVERLTAPLRGVNGDAEVVLQLLLADELVELARPESEVERLFVFDDVARDDALSSRGCGTFPNTCATQGIITRESRSNRLAWRCGSGDRRLGGDLLHKLYGTAERLEAFVQIATVGLQADRCDAGVAVGADAVADHVFGAEQV
jgi:hypothetical protein